ncbi:CesT family type III secretion system chaperone [Herbaspirillum huttiense]|uniref:CesT family type III secretion system chaperone n=1 Tax=Herbaspirillum huttiense TaxID=863372 RepID=UPI002176CB71|nr:CesT family type III secretion system chaperone [Herbaspirillum huttiense]UWE18913.1 CesT family type III secretion system chaperone [Herbaspirillum huttiense]
MSKQQYEQLIHQLCNLCQIKGAQGILEGGPVAVNDVVFSLAHHEQVSPDTLLVYCDFGAVEAGREAQAYRALLETNLLMYAGNGPIYTLSPATGRVVFANRYRLGGMDAVMLRSILAHLAAKAMDWRKDQLLDPPPVRRHHGHASKIPQLWSRPTLTDDDAFKH